MTQIAFRDVALQAVAAFAELEAELAKVDAGEGRHLLRVGREVPRLDAIAAEFDQLDVLHSVKRIRFRIKLV